jgi:hypothetical protein
MRYFFLPEIEEMLRSSDFQPLAAFRWLSVLPPDPTAWSACVISRAIMPAV